MLNFICPLMIFVYSILNTSEGVTAHETCNCYTLGTLCSIEGESLCDSDTLQCECHPNVSGRNCNACSEGFYDILSGQGCSNCHCSPSGSTNKTCNLLTGQCQCKEGFFGLRCDQCASFSYKSSPEKCLSCGCNVYGSKDLQCDITGQCPCMKNVEGRQCDRCKENTYDIQKGCIQCPSCYKFVQDAVENYTKYLGSLESRIEDIENDLPLLIQDYKQFLTEIKGLKDKIQKLKGDCEKAVTGTSLQSLSELNDGIKDLLADILLLTEKIKAFDLAEIKDSLSTNQKMLDEANDLALTCHEALNNATEQSKHLNRHNKTVSNIAKHVLLATAEIESKTVKLDTIASETKQKCNETCSLADEFSKNQTNLAMELVGLQEEIKNTTMDVETFEKYLAKFKKEMDVRRKKAIELNKAAKNLEILDTQELSENLKKVEENSKDFEMRIKDIEAASEDVQSLMDSTGNKFEELQGKQKQMDDLYKKLDEYNYRADTAINSTNYLIESAKESLENMQDYEAIKQAAIAALANFSAIQDKIDAVIANANPIERIFREINVTLHNLEEIQGNVSKLLTEIENNETEVEKHFRELNELQREQQILTKNLENSDVQLKQIRSKLEQQKKFQLKIEHEIKRLEEFILYLDAIPTTKEELDEIEKEINKTERIFDEIELLTKEKAELEKQVEIIRQIVESIPIDDPSLCESAKSEPKAILF